MLSMRSLLLCLSLLLTACASSAPVSSRTELESDWIQVLFTDPYAPGAGDVAGGPDEAIAAAITQARTSVHMAIYDLNLWSIRDALLDAHERGLDVRLVVEASNMDRRELQQLAQAGIPLVADTNPNFMHNKFIVIDEYQVWTGSSNYTVSDMYGNRNNMLRINSSQLAANYTNEFEEMFERGYFGEETLDNTPHQEIYFGDVEVHSYFSPDDSVAIALVDVIDSAEETVYFLAFSLTLDELGDALVRAQQRGIEVVGIMDDAQVGNTGGEYEFLRQNDVQVYLDERGVNLHDKVLIVDETIVVTGSYNFSSNAEYRNDENTLVIYSADLAKDYLEYFRLLRALAEK